jgi:hypothetical protein
MSPEKVISVVFSRLESVKNAKRRLQGVPFSQLVQSVRKRVKIIPKLCLFNTILMSVFETRSLDNLFNFKESEKRLTMDSQPFSRLSLLILKKYKI